MQATGTVIHSTLKNNTLAAQYFHPLVVLCCCHALRESVAPAVRFAEMDVTDLKADGAFFDKMIERGVFEAEEVREVVEAFLR